MEKIIRFLEVIKDNGYNPAKYRILTHTGTENEIIMKIHNRIIKNKNEDEKEELKKIFLYCFN